MKNKYFKTIVAAALAASATMTWAQNFPTFPTQELQDGGKYIICNLANPTGYMARTSWDGAYYFLGETDSKYQEREVTAHYDSESNRWLLTTSETYHAAVEADEEKGIEAQDAYTTYTYFGVPGGTDNVNGNLTEEAYWVITPSPTAKGFYILTASDGQQNPQVIGKSMHLNAGGQYWVISEPTNGWYPDFMGGVKKEEDGTDVVIYEEETDTYYKVMADSTSMNWAFVHVEDVPAYVEVSTQWSKIRSFETNYCSIEGYEEGFKLTLEAATKAFDEQDYTTMQAIIDAKVNLYNQLLKALATDTDKLDAAIATAQEAFNTLADAEATDAAYQALKKACDDYALGLGDITAMGTNMSFEDLSSQNGQPTSGVAAPPAGWDVYINGEKKTTQSEVSQYVTAWHGINADCNGYKDGEYGFGLWTANVPEYQLSQTITGLDNGAYTITCGLMVGANGAGSRRTTQRVFANLSSTYFGSIDEYNEDMLDMDVRNYANLTEPTTDQEMQEISVRAYVYDGSLTFGIRTNGNWQAANRTGVNGAGGDGWFKCDNFTISKDGADHDLLLETAELVTATFDKLSEEPMPASLKDRMDEIAADYGVNAGMSDADLELAITKANTEIEGLDEIKAGIEAYAKLLDKLTETQERLETCIDNGYKGADTFGDTYDEVANNYSDGVYETAEVDSIIALLEEAYQTCLHSGVSEGADVSDLIVNRSFEDLSAQGGNNSDGVANAPKGWDLYINGVKCETADEIRAQGVTAWCAINSGDNINVTDEYGTTHTHQYTDGTHVWGIWNASIPSIELSQTITDLEPGTYILTADVMARNTDWSGKNLTTQRIFANDAICLYGSDNDYIPEYLMGSTSDDIYQAYFLTMIFGKQLDSDEDYEYLNYGEYDANYNDVLLRQLVLHFGVDETGVAKIGFRTDGINPWTGTAQEQQASGWFKLDNFTLYFESSKIPTAIEKVGASKTTQSGIYNIAGQRMAKPRKGVNIIDGKKVIR